jgi:ferredoxin
MPTLRVEPNGETFDVPTGSPMLDYCRANDVPIDFGCTVGSCGTCRVIVVAGGDTLALITEEEQETVEMCTDAENVRLMCQCVMGSGDLTVRAED